MCASRPIALGRSLSDSGFEITAQESGLAYYNTHMLIRQNADAVMMRDRRNHKRDAVSHLGDVLASESKACVMDHSLGVVDMVIDTLSRELEVPFMSSNGELYYNTHHHSASPPPYNSETVVKSVVSDGDLHEVDQTAVKVFHTRSSDPESGYGIMQKPPAYEDLSDDDVRHLIDSVGGLHKKLDLLQSKMNNLLHQKSDKDTPDENLLQLKQKSDSKHEFIAKKGLGLTANEDIGKRIFPRDSVYVQIEQVYYNLQRMNFLHRPFDGFEKKFPLFSQTKPAPKQTAEAATSTTADSDTDLKSLRKRCDHLEKENALLQQELKKMQKSEKKIPPVPAPRQKKSTERGTPFVVGPPTAPPKCPPLLKDIRMTEVTYEWTIPDYYRQFHEQRSGLVHKTISEPFFITHNGYCARMEAFLDGDGCHKGSFFSLFLRILPSKMDDQLLWPAHLKLSFILVNQTDKPGAHNKSHMTIVEHRFPRPNNSGIYESGARDCWGVLNLASHEKIHSPGFIRDDKLLLQCRVHILSSWRRSRRGKP